jgi:hypothetical protein
MQLQHQLLYLELEQLAPATCLQLWYKLAVTKHAVQFYAINEVLQCTGEKMRNTQGADMRSRSGMWHAEHPGLCRSHCNEVILKHTGGIGQQP